MGNDKIAGAGDSFVGFIVMISLVVVGAAGWASEANGCCCSEAEMPLDGR